MHRRVISRCVRYYSIKTCPFEYTQQQANEKFAQKSLFEKSNNKTGLTEYIGNKIVKKFLPFHTAQFLGLRSRFKGQYGIDRSETYYIGKTMYTRSWTDWYDIAETLEAVNYPFGLKETQVYANFEYIRSYVEDILYIQNYYYLREMDIDSALIESHTMKMQYALQIILGRISDLEYSRTSDHIKSQHGADRVNISVEPLIQWSKIELASFHLPAYIYYDTITENSKKFKMCKIMSGISGETHGDVLYSPVKIGATIGSVASVLSLFIFKIHPAMAIGSILFRIGVIPSLIGLSSGLITKYSFEYRYKKKYNVMKEEAENNKYFEESEDDKKRQRIKDNTKSKSSEEKTRHRTEVDPDDDYAVLGLNASQTITLEILRKARNDKLKLWHPDMFVQQKDKYVCDDMTKRIIEAHDRIKKKIT